jgi:hypothetical protein
MSLWRGSFAHQPLLARPAPPLPGPRTRPSLNTPLRALQVMYSVWALYWVWLASCKPRHKGGKRSAGGAADETGNKQSVKSKQAQADKEAFSRMVKVN